jgi:aminobenzoyl-glutamate utilization protein A
MTTPVHGEWLRAIRRDLHRRPEPAWCEFYTTARIVRELEALDVDEVILGPDLLDDEARAAVPDERTLADWRDRAVEAGADENLVDQMEGGRTGVGAICRRGEGPTVALRVDIDGLPRVEADTGDHRPAAEGFRSVHEGYMHACGHDAHAAIGLGVLRAVTEGNDFDGTLKVVFQPAEETVAGARAVAEGGRLDDADALLGLHVGLDHPTGEVVAGIDDILAVRHLDAGFTGEGAHASAHPEVGRNAVQAMAAAVQNLYAIPRHGDGVTRVNAGRVGGGTASNIIPEAAFIEAEVRGATTPLRDSMTERAERVCEAAAEMHDCEVALTRGPEAPSADPDSELVAIVAAAAEGCADVETVLESAPLDASEDVTYLMRRVQDRGGLATFVCVGTDHPGGHHAATFDVDEQTLDVGVRVLTRALDAAATAVA